MTSQVAILMGSASDWHVMKKAADILDEFKITYEAKVLSAHRTPKETVQYVEESEKNGVKVFIAGAGMSAALPGVLSSATTLPVIGVPIESGPLKGQDALYAVAQMPPGISVACMAINGAKNAGIYAAQILSVSDPEIAERVKKNREEAKEKVLNTVL